MSITSRRIRPSFRITAHMDEQRTISESIPEDLPGFEDPHHRRHRQGAGSYFSISYVKEHWLFLLCVSVLACQFLLLVSWSVILYRRFDLGLDFGTYFQAVSQIAHGHVNPYDTINDTSFLRNHFELIVWPLSLSQLIDPSPYPMLLIQDVAIVAAEGVALLWVSDIHARRGLGDGIPRWVGVSLVLLLLILNPWTYKTAITDFHAETIATLFTVLAARDLYNERTRRASIWFVLLLMCGDVGGIYMVGLAIGLVLARPRAWKIAIAWISIGIAWVVAISYGGFNNGSLLYDYHTLTGKTGAAAYTITLADIIEQTLLHPDRLWHLVVQRWSIVLQNIAPTGIIGIFSRWVIGLFLLVVLTSIGQDYAAFIEPGFQNIVLYVMLPVGTLLVLDGIVRKLSATRIRAIARHSAARFSAATPRMWAAGALIAALCVSCLVYASEQIPTVFAGPPDTQVGTRSVLTGVLEQTPAGAEVVVSSGILGRFAGRRSVYSLSQPSRGTSVPIVEKQVVFVFVPELSYGESASAIQTETQFVNATLHAKTLSDGDGVWAYLWSVPRNVTGVAWWPVPAEVTSAGQ